jgi:hypothetical protein
MPYNYLVDSKIRKNLGLDLKNSIVILDEGHNVVNFFFVVGGLSGVGIGQ